MKKHIFVTIVITFIYLIARCVENIDSKHIGIYLISKDKLLLLEEAFMRVMNYAGDILMNELFDLVEDFSISQDKLLIQANEEVKVFDLNQCRQM